MPCVDGLGEIVLGFWDVGVAAAGGDHEVWLVAGWLVAQTRACGVIGVEDAAAA